MSDLLAQTLVIAIMLVNKLTQLAKLEDVSQEKWNEISKEFNDAVKGFNDAVGRVSE